MEQFGLDSILTLAALFVGFISLLYTTKTFNKKITDTNVRNQEKQDKMSFLVEQLVQENKEIMRSLAANDAKHLRTAEEIAAIKSSLSATEKYLDRLNMFASSQQGLPPHMPITGNTIWGPQAKEPQWPEVSTQ